MSAFLVVACVVFLYWGIEQHIARRVDKRLAKAVEGVTKARKDLNEAQEKHIEALKEALELTERQVLLLKIKLNDP